MYAMRRRCQRGSSPKTFTAPRVGAISPAIIRSSVDLPAPFSPSTTVDEPAANSTVTLRSAANPPYSFDTASSRAAAARTAPFV